MIGLSLGDFENKPPGVRYSTRVFGPHFLDSCKGHHVMNGGMNRVNILLVEDEALISEMMTVVLNEGGFEVHACANADDALRYLASDCGIDLLFTDVDLPGGLDGSALALRARELRPTLPVVYASGSGLDHARAVPGSRFVPKPYSPFKICSLLSELVSTSPH
jgi:CheY-like chemotaxis protein